MILSIAHAPAEAAAATDMFGAWSDVVVDAQPAGLVDAYLVQGDGRVQVVAVWASIEDHDRAIEDESSHPAFGFFEACGIDPAHAVYEVIGRLQAR